MAVDPRLSEEEKDSLRNLRRDLESPTRRAYRRLTSPTENVAEFRRSGLSGLGRDISRAASDTLSTTGDVASSAADFLLYGDEGPPPAPPSSLPASARQAASDAARTQRDALLADAAGQVRRDPGKFGLTRIYKTRDANGNSVYSNVGEAPAGAETRYYNQYGNREGVDVTGRRLTRDPAASDINLLVAAGHGRQSQKWVGRVAAETAAAREKAALAALDPAQRAQLMIAQLRESGEDRRSLRRDKIDAAKFDLDTQRFEADTAKALSDREFRDAQAAQKDPSGTVQRFIAENSNLSPAEFAKVLADPENKNAAAARAAFSQILQAQEGTDFTANTMLGGLKANPGWVRALGGNRYRNAASGIFGGAVGGDDIVLPDNISDDTLQAFIDADILSRSRRK